MFCLSLCNNFNATTLCRGSDTYFRWKSSEKPNVKLQESPPLFTGKNCVQNSLFWLLPLLIFCGLYLKGIRTERKKVCAAISLIPLCNIGWVQQLLRLSTSTWGRRNKVENKISKQENKWIEVTEQGFLWLRGLGAKSRTKSYFKHSRDLFNSRPIKKGKTRYKETDKHIAHWFNKATGQERDDGFWSTFGPWPKGQNKSCLRPVKRKGEEKKRQRWHICVIVCT